MVRRWSSNPNSLGDTKFGIRQPETTPEGGLDLVFLESNGRIRTGALSVPNAGRGVCGGPGWTKAQVTQPEEQAPEPHEGRRAFNLDPELPGCGT